MSTTVLVRGLRWGPGVAPPPDDDGLSNKSRRSCTPKVKYRFPGDYEIDLAARFPDDNKVLVDLLSIATRSPLISHTSFVRVAKWVEEIDPNFAFGSRSASASLPDASPKEHQFCQHDAAAFVTLASRWCTYRGRRDVIDLRSVGSPLLSLGSAAHLTRKTESSMSLSPWRSCTVRSNRN